MKTLIVMGFLLLGAYSIGAEDNAYRPFTATAYCHRGRMANGQKVHSGAMATDRRVLPLGTVVHIQGMGTYVSKDTGSAIKGNRIDLWLSSCKAAIKFGRRKVNLKVL